MKPAAFEYFAPETLEEALALRAELAGSCVVLAGGQSLLPMLNLRLVSPAALLDLRRIGELAEIREEPDGVCVGATVTQRSAERSALLACQASLVAEALALVGHPAIRNRGTVGGSIAHADPAAELPAVASALDAVLALRSERRARRMQATDFFRGPFATALEPDELLVGVLLPHRSAGSGFAFAEVSRRRGDFALVGVAAALQLRGGALARATIVAAGVGGTPFRVDADALGISGAPATPEALEAAAESAGKLVEPHSDLHASAGYRRHVTRVLVRRTLATAVARAGAETA
jgi:aerobic carbon-monoxide dehydrogenase medium subunit